MELSTGTVDNSVERWCNVAVAYWPAKHIHGDELLAVARPPAKEKPRASAARGFW